MVGNTFLRPPSQPTLPLPNTRQAAAPSTQAGHALTMRPSFHFTNHPSLPPGHLPGDSSSTLATTTSLLAHTRQLVQRVSCTSRTTASATASSSVG